MEETDRRAVLRNAGLAVTAAAIGGPPATALAQTEVSKVTSPSQATELPDDLTRRLARGKESNLPYEG